MTERLPPGLFLVADRKRFEAGIVAAHLPSWYIHFS